MCGIHTCLYLSRIGHALSYTQPVSAKKNKLTTSELKAISAQTQKTQQLEKKTDTAGLSVSCHAYTSCHTHIHVKFSDVSAGFLRFLNSLMVS